MRPNQQFIDSLTVGGKWVTQFTSGPYGSMLLIPYNYVGSTASGREFKLGTSGPENVYFETQGGNPRSADQW
jgi:hypothetical protein